ncbi:MAG: AAA family ATPase [Bacteroidales bacterium]|nr:AAA family ATPase [Bacteroidales bacterium]
MYKRKIEEILKKWKANSNRFPLVIKGCRQCGKTFSVVNFARSNYKYVVYMDFFNNPEYKDIFNGSLDVDRICLRISSLVPGAKIVANETCFVFDEIQDCPKARMSLKFFKIDGRYDVICTGSLLGVNGYRSSNMNKDDENTPLPVGYETIIDMYPMDFEEWLWANGISKPTLDYLRDCFDSKEPVDEAIHNRMRQLMLQYVIVGGMPRAVNAFFETNNYQEVQIVQRGIVDEYKSDMIKYAPSQDKPRIRECFESIPKQLSRENKKFSYSVVRAGGRGRDYVGSLQWIEDAGIIRRCYNLEITELPLDGNAIYDQFKVYMADTGLFVSMLEEGTAWAIEQGNLLSYKGAIFENLVADILGKAGRKLYYFRKDSGLEVDFVIRYCDKCTLLECKASSGNVKSAKTILQHPEKYHVYDAIKLGDYNIGHTGQFVTLPIYMAFML